MKTDAVCYYYKDPTNGVEMNFTKTGGYGWGVSFPKGFDSEQMIDYPMESIPWPVLSEQEQAEVDAHYDKLINRCWENKNDQN